MSLSVLRAAAAVLLLSPACFGAVNTVVGFNDPQTATSDFKFSNVPSPSKSDAASKVQFLLVTGQKDDASGELIKLHDGKLPESAEDPAGNFFFKAGTDGGRVVIDLGSVIEVKQINTYSWSSGTHAAQVYKVFGSDGRANNFSTQPSQEGGAEGFGWKRIAKVDTRPASGTGAGQYAVSLTDSRGVLGRFRYIMFDFSVTENTDDQGNTYYSEIDIIDANAPASAAMPNRLIPRHRREFAPAVDRRLLANTLPVNPAPPVSAGAVDAAATPKELALAVPANR